MLRSQLMALSNFLNSRPAARFSIVRWLLPLWLVAILAAAPAPSEADIPNIPSAVSGLYPLPLRIIGQVLRSPGTTQFQWPAISFEARFKGKEAFVGALTGRSRFQLFVDDRLVRTLRGPSAGEWVSGLGPGHHAMRLMRIDEDRDKVASFAGVFVKRRGEALPPPAPRRHQIEFIGDSFQAGFGLTAGKQACTDDEFWATTDTSQTYATLLAHDFTADFKVLAYSCIGLVRNCSFRRSTPTMPSLYRRALFDQDGTASPEPFWKPGLIVVALGGNDFSEPIDRGEHWHDLDEVKKAFGEEIIRFAQRLRSENPQAFILLLDYDDPATAALHAKAVERRTAAGDRRVGALTVHGPFALSGCFQHLDAVDNRKIAAEVETWLRQHDLLSGKPRS